MDKQLKLFVWYGVLDIEILVALAYDLEEAKAMLLDQVPLDTKNRENVLWVLKGHLQRSPGIFDTPDAFFFGFSNLDSRKDAEWNKVLKGKDPLTPQRIGLWREAYRLNYSKDQAARAVAEFDEFFVGGGD